MDPEREDAEWMLRLQDGEDAALNALMTRWQVPLVSFIHRYIDDRSQALDLAQETFIRVYQSRQRYRATAKFSSWLFTIASNLCKNYTRWQHRHPVVSLVRDDDGAGDVLDAFPSPGKSPHDAAGDNDLARCVKEGIQGLPHDLKTVVLLFEYEDLSYEAIAAVLGCSAKAVETRLYRARKILREKLEWLNNPGRSAAVNQSARALPASTRR